MGKWGIIWTQPNFSIDTLAEHVFLKKDIYTGVFLIKGNISVVCAFHQ